MNNNIYYNSTLINMGRVSANSSFLLIISSFLLLLLLAFQIHASSEKVGKKPPIVPGLKWNYYGLLCPIETVIRNALEDVFKDDPSQGPGILRLFFHDCFTQGCDASILLDGANGESVAEENIGLNQAAIQTIENLRRRVNKKCPLVAISCADVLTLAAREAVRQFGGPDIDVPLGRKDSLDFDMEAVENLPGSFFRTDELLESFAERDLDETDLVALSGAHTYGVTHCESIAPRTTEATPPIDPDFKSQIEATCPTPETNRTFNLDKRTPNTFDNMYYINLLNREGVFISDQDLASHAKTKEIVNSFASNQKLFFEKFEWAFVKVSQIDVLTKKQGEVRKNCLVPNKKLSSSVVKEVVKSVKETVA